MMYSVVLILSILSYSLGQDLKPISRIISAPVAAINVPQPRAFPPNKSGEVEDSEFVILSKAKPKPASHANELSRIISAPVAAIKIPKPRAFPPNKVASGELDDNEFVASVPATNENEKDKEDTIDTSKPIKPAKENTSTCNIKAPKQPNHRNCEFRVTDELVPACQAEQACHHLGMKLADLRSDNWERAVSTLFHSIGSNQYGWVNSWNGDSYHQAPCIALYTGLTERGGAVNVPLSCNIPRPALCQRGVRFH